MKPRTVIVTLKVLTTIPIKDLRNKEWWNKGSYGGKSVAQVEQVKAVLSWGSAHRD